LSIQLENFKGLLFVRQWITLSVHIARFMLGNITI
jgi:hypothetical protein